MLATTDIALHMYDVLCCVFFFAVVASFIPSLSGADGAAGVDSFQREHVSFCVTLCFITCSRWNYSSNSSNGSRAIHKLSVWMCVCVCSVTQYYIYVVWSIQFLPTLARARAWETDRFITFVVWCKLELIRWQHPPDAITSAGQMECAEIPQQCVFIGVHLIYCIYIFVCRVTMDTTN